MSNNLDLFKGIKAFAFDIDGVLSKQTITLDSDGELLRTMNIRDGYAIRWAIKVGFPVTIITGGYGDALVTRFSRIDVPSEDIHMKCHFKVPVFEEFLKRHNLKAEEVLYMGDDIPDYEVMKMVGVAAAPKDAAKEILEISNYISPINGGEGCGRDVIQKVLEANNLWMSDKRAFGW